MNSQRPGQINASTVFAITMAVVAGLIFVLVFKVIVLDRPRAVVRADADTAAEKKAIQQVLDDQDAAWNRKDLEGFMAGYWKSPDLRFYSGGDVRRGWDETLDRYRKRYQAEGKEKMGTLTFSDLEIEVLGPDVAFARGRWQLVMEKEKPGGLFTLLLKKLPEGWRIVHDHTSVPEKP